MNIELQNKYGFDILIDFDVDWLNSVSSRKLGALIPAEPLMQPDAFASLLRRAAGDSFQISTAAIPILADPWREWFPNQSKSCRLRKKRDPL